MNQNGTWVKVARAEGDWSLYPPEARFTEARLRRMAEVYDPKFRRATVVCGYDPATGAAGPAHEMGRYLPTRGQVNALRFDGEYLEAEIVQAEDHQGKPAVTELVKRGFTAPSIKRMLHSELPGEDWYLEHVALLAGEPPGTPGLPPLSDVFRALDVYGLSESLPFVPAHQPQLGSDGLMQPSLYRSLAECERSHVQPTPTPDDGPPAEEEPSMTPEEIGAAVARALAEALPQAVAPLKDELAAVRTLAEQAKAEATTASTTARSLADTTAAATAETRLKECVRTARLAPRDLPMMLKACRSLPEKERGELLTEIEGRKPMRLDRALQFDEATGEPAPELDTHEFTGPGGGGVDPDRAELHQRTLSIQSKNSGMTYEAALTRALAGEGAN